MPETPAQIARFVDAISELEAAAADLGMAEAMTDVFDALHDAASLYDPNDPARS